MANTNCIQTNIPTTDESTIDCNGEYISTDCVIHSEAISILELPEDSNLTTIIENLLLALIDVKNRLEIAEDNINTLLNT